MKYTKFKYLVEKNKFYIAALVSAISVNIGVSWYSFNSPNFFANIIKNSFTYQAPSDMIVKEAGQNYNYNSLAELSQKLNGDEYAYVYNYDVVCKMCNIVVSDIGSYPVSLNFSKYITPKEKNTIKIQFPLGYTLKNSKDNFYTIDDGQFRGEGSKYITLYNEKTRKSKIIIYQLTTIESNSIKYPNIIGSGLFMFALFGLIKTSREKTLAATIAEKFINTKSDSNTYRETCALAREHLDNVKFSSSEIKEIVKLLQNPGTLIDTSKIKDLDIDKEFFSFVSQLREYRENKKHVIGSVFIDSLTETDERFKKIHDSFKEYHISYLPCLSPNILNKFFDTLISANDKQAPILTRRYHSLIHDYNFPINNDILLCLMKARKNKAVESLFETIFPLLSLKELSSFVRNNTVTPEISTMLEKRQLEDTLKPVLAKKASHKI